MYLVVVHKDYSYSGLNNGFERRLHGDVKQKTRLAGTLITLKVPIASIAVELMWLKNLRQSPCIEKPISWTFPFENP